VRSESGIGGIKKRCLSGAIWTSLFAPYNSHEPPDATD
jgi:hypothetical protein